MNKLFVFDLDDTLINNVHDYADPILNACRLIIEVLGAKAPHVSQIIAMEQEIDTRRVREINPSTGEPYLFSMERFPTSLVEVYREICKQAKVAPKEAVEVELYLIGHRAFDENRYVKNIKPNALSVLDFLLEKKDSLVLCTKGDPRVQEKKIKALKQAGIDHFSTMRVVNEKTPEVFRGFLAGFGQDEFYSVGNSYSSDIVPALSAGFTGIYIPVETWETIGQMDSILAEVDTNKCLVLQSLEELKTQYERLR
jgi:FMN phosphatase YigB (HAD superfamily)